MIDSYYRNLILSGKEARKNEIHLVIHNTRFERASRRCSNDFAKHPPGISRHYVKLLSTAGASRPAVFILPQAIVPVVFDLQSAAEVNEG